MVYIKIKYLLKFIKIPKTDLEKQLDKIDGLKNNPDNYYKVAMMYYKLQNIYSMLIGRNGNDNLNFFLSNFCEKQYKMYIDLYMENKLNL